MQSFKRPALAATLISAVAVSAGAPAAVARPDLDRPAAAPAKVSAPTLADLASRREAISSEQWRRANRTPVVKLSDGGGDGLEWGLVLAGGALLMFGGVVSATTVGRRRNRDSATA
jgi:hypothetical protein